VGFRVAPEEPVASSSMKKLLILAILVALGVVAAKRLRPS
jgi:RNase P/RNase MRP subunit POP5